MNQIGGTISEFIKVFNQHIKKLIQSSDIVVYVFVFFERRVPQNYM